MRRMRATMAAVVALGFALSSRAEPEIGPPPSVLAQSKTESKGLGPVPSAQRTPTSARGGAADSGWMGKTTVSLASVLGLAVAGAAALRVISRRNGGLRSSLGAGGKSPAGIMEVLGRYPVGRGATLVLLKLDRRILLLSQTALGKLGLGSSFTPLCEITDPDEVASILVKTRDADGESMSERFRSMLGAFDRTMPADEPPTGRRIQSGPGGDRAEIWDESRTDIPVVDLTRRAEGSTVAATGTAATTLRRRLAAIRWPSQQGGESL